MKRYVKYMIAAMVVAFATACSGDVEQGGMAILAERGIVLNLSGGALGVATRAEDMADNEREYAIQHLDVMIFNDAEDREDMSLFYHERVTAAGPSGEVRLGVDIDSIVVGAKYWVYVVANSTYDASTFAEMESVASLHTLSQHDYNLHLTATGLQNTSSHFLMDGVAYKSASEPATAAAITIAEQKITDVVRLNVKLRRAAAKVVVRLLATETIEFTDAIVGATPGYYVRNLPYATRVVNDGVLRQQDNLETTHEAMSEYYKWMRDAEGNITGVEITLYVYSHMWDTSDSFSHATNLLVDVPAYYSAVKEGARVSVEHPNNYYQVPLTQEFKFERNHYYEVTANVHAPGAEDFSEPVQIQDLKYSVYQWTERRVDIGGEQGPEYLKVNLDELKMYNTAIDSKSLLFSSSSPVTITVENCYYIDKFGVRRTISADSYNIAGTTPDGSIAGNITVMSDVPTNNTIRYFTLRVVNETGQEEIVVVEQYPLVYIVNILGHYSYRDDFRTTSDQATSYIYRGDRISSVSLDSYSTSTQQWSYTRNNNAGRGFWSSKVATEDYPEGSGSRYEGRSRIQYYTWGSSGNSPSHGSNTDNPGNARMYHVRVTATSGDYALGVPRMVQNTNTDFPYEYTDSGDDNATLVSPSFMTASRLSKVDIQNYGSGLSNDERRYAMARDHCAWYVEVDREGNVYDNWRLPTAAELKIIMDLQGTANESADAIDYLLDADYYMSASGLVYNSKNSDNSADNGNKSQWAIRCIRDAY
ncbi:MAG: hypothetical protein IKY50_03795 [Alistipes sp.]|nr:hypothetical protein [Alistipes sp.]